MVTMVSESEQLKVDGAKTIEPPAGTGAAVAGAVVVVETTVGAASVAAAVTA